MTIRRYAAVVLLPIRHLVVMLPLLLSAACTDGAPVRPTTPVVDAVDFQLTGVVTDDDGMLMAGAVVSIGFVALDSSGSAARAVTNQSGVYAVVFKALRGVRGSALGGPGSDRTRQRWPGPTRRAAPGRCGGNPAARRSGHPLHRFEQSAGHAELPAASHDARRGRRTSHDHCRAG